MVDEFPQAQLLGEGHREQQPSIGHQAVVVKRDLDAIGMVAWQHLLGAPCFRAVFCYKTIIPDSEEHPLPSSRAVPKAVPRWIRAYTPFQGEPGAAPVRLIVRRVKPTPGSQLALFATYSYHGFITDRDGEMLELEADHRRHAEIENAIRDLKYGVGLNHMPSGRFAANGAWLAVQVMAHNLARWTARIGLG